MSAARDAILARIRAAASDGAGRPAAPAAPRGPAPAPAAGDAERLAARIADYRAAVTRVAAGDAAIAAAVAEALGRHAARRVVVPPGLPVAWLPPGIEALADDPPLDHDAIAAADGVLTGCALAIAQTGTIVLDHTAGQGRRALTLLPDLHVCVVRADQVVADVPDAIAALGDRRRPVTFVSGPSATSDIELNRVEGVHGPRRLEVVLAG